MVRWEWLRQCNTIQFSFRPLRVTSHLLFSGVWEDCSSKRTPANWVTRSKNSDYHTMENTAYIFQYTETYLNIFSQYILQYISFLKGPYQWNWALTKPLFKTGLSIHSCTVFLIYSAYLFPFHKRRASVHTTLKSDF